MEQQQATADLINWANKKQNQYKTASAKYYNKNFTIRDDMTPDEKLKVAENIKKRQEYYKRKYKSLIVMIAKAIHSIRRGTK